MLFDRISVSALHTMVGFVLERFMIDGLVVVLPSTSMQCDGSGGDDVAGFPPTWVVASTFSHVLVPDRACPCTVAILVTAGPQPGDLG